MRDGEARALSDARAIDTTDTSHRQAAESVAIMTRPEQWERTGAPGQPSRRPRAPRPPVRAGSVLAAMPMFRRRPDRLRQLARILAQAHESAAQCRAAVLADPDASARLCRLMGYRRPDQWTGYVPPPRLATGGRNDSPYAAGLVEIVNSVFTPGAG